MSFEADKKRLKYLRRIHTMFENARIKYVNGGYNERDAEIMTRRSFAMECTARECLEIAERMMNRVKITDKHRGQV